MSDYYNQAVNLTHAIRELRAAQNRAFEVLSDIDDEAHDPAKVLLAFSAEAAGRALEAFGVEPGKETKGGA